jgi:hypothetical protein
VQRQDTTDHEMPNNDDGEVCRGIVGTMVMQSLSAVRTAVIHLQILPEQRSLAALRAVLRKAAAHGLQDGATRPVGDLYGHGPYMALEHSKVHEASDPGQQADEG